MLARPAIRLRRWLVAIGLGLMIAGVAAVAILRIWFEGPDLGNTVASIMNKSMRGRIAIGSIEWPTSGVKTVVTGGWLPLTLRDVKVWDDQDTATTTGELVLDVPKITAEIDIHALMFGRHDFVLRNIRVFGGRVLLKEVAEPYALHAYDRKVFSLLAAFYGRRKGGFYAGIAARSSPVFDLRDYTIEGLELEIWSGLSGGSYSFRGLVHDVGGSGFLYMDSSDPLVPKFYFAVAPTGGPGELDVLWERDKAGVWSGFYRFPIDRLDVTTLKQIPTTWPQSPVANTLLFDLGIGLTSGAQAHVKGAMVDYWDTPYGGSWDVTASVTNAGPMLKQSILVDLGGDDVKVDARVTGPIVYYPKIALGISGLTYDLKDYVPLDPTTGLAESVPLELDKLTATYDLAVNAGAVNQVVARGVGGELTLSATFEGDGSNAAPFLIDAQISIDKPLEMSRWMAPCQRKILGTTLAGHVRARRYQGDTALLAVLQDFEVRFGRIRVSAGAEQPNATPPVAPGTITADQNFTRYTLQNVDIDYASIRGAKLAKLTFDLNSAKLPPFELKLTSGSLGDYLALQRATTCATPPPAKPTRRAQPRAAPRPPRRPASVRARPRLAVVPPPPAARAHRQAQRSPLDKIHLRNVEATSDGDGTIRATNVQIADVPVVGLVYASAMRYVDATGVLSLTNVRLPNLGGSIRADGSVDLSGDVRLRAMRVRATDADLGKLALTGQRVKGKLSADLALSGPADVRSLSAEGWACSNRLTALGDTFADVGVWLGQAPAGLKACPGVRVPTGDTAACLAAAKAGGRCAVVAARREAGGLLAVIAGIDRAQRLDGSVAINGLPLAALAGLAGASWPAGASLDAAGLRLSGTVDAPVVDGVVRVSRAWALGGFLGDGELQLASAGPGAVRLTATFLDGRLVASGRLGTTAPYPLDLTVDVSRLPLDGFVDLAARLGLPSAQAQVSGRLRLRTALADPAAPLAVTLELSDLTATVGVPGLAGGTASVAVRLGAPVVATYDGAELRLTQPATLVTDVGAVAVVGTVSATRIALNATGTIDLARTLPLARGQIDDVTGTAELEAALVGPTTAPRINAKLRLDKVGVRLARQDAWLRIPEGQVALVAKGVDATGAQLAEVSFTGLRAEVDDGYSTDPASLGLAGGVTLRDYRPDEWNLIITGALGGEMLVVPAADQIASASGAADVNIRLFGQGPIPEVDGLITFDPARPLTVFARSLRREVALAEGTVTITNQATDRAQVTIELDSVGGTLDGEGRLRDVSGRVNLRGLNLDLAAGSMTGALEAFPYRIPRQLDLIVNVALGITLTTGQLAVAGKVDLVSGRYLVDFNLGEYLRPAAPSEPAAPPFWETSPLLAGATLDLKVDARRFSVQNNIANIDFEGTLDLTGTPRDPRLDGTILVQRGTFKIPGLRPRFTRTSGSVQFSALQPLGPTPTLDLSTEADYRDPTGQDHVITLTLTNSLEKPNFDLSTDSGLNKAQTLTLIISGRTPDEFRRNIGQGAIGSDPTRIDPSTDTSQGYTDELFRQAAGDLLTRAVADTLRDWSGLDVARIEFNLGSFGFHGEVKAFERFRLIGDLERTTRGSTISGRGELRIATWASGELSYLAKNFDDAAESDIIDTEVKLVLRGTWRGPWR
ncbi:MAG: translocation/assembly module TamB domain-containing protein [Kofleriaceae bacterium]